MPKEVEGFISKEINVKIREMKRLFPEMFEHIQESDLACFRIDKKGNIPMRMIINDQDPWQYIIPFKYVLIIYQEYDFLTVDQQFQALAHQICKIPKNYKTNPKIRYPDIIKYNEEKQIEEWLKEHKFSHLF